MTTTLADVRAAQPEWFSRKNKRFFGDVGYKVLHGKVSGKPFLVRSTYAWSTMFGQPKRLTWRVNPLDERSSSPTPRRGGERYDRAEESRRKENAMTKLQCETCTRRNIETDALRCPACGSVDLRGYDPEANVNAEMLAALKRAAPWLGKMIADGAHQNAVLPRDCERTLEMVEAAIERAEAENVKEAASE